MSFLSIPRILNICCDINRTIIRRKGAGHKKEGSVDVPNRVVSHLMLDDSCSFAYFRQGSSTEMETDSIYFHVIYGLQTFGTASPN